MVMRFWEVTMMRRSRQQLIGLACRVVHLYRLAEDCLAKAAPNAVPLPPLSLLPSRSSLYEVQELTYRPRDPPRNIDALKIVHKWPSRPHLLSASSPLARLWHFG